MMAPLSIQFWKYDFLAPEWLWLITLVPVILVLRYQARQRTSGDHKVSRSAKDLEAISFDHLKWLVYGIYLVLFISLSLLIMALAKPFDPAVDHAKQEYGEGIDIILCMDISGSMLATDFLPNRLEAAKEVAKEFVSNRPSDRIGLVVFEGEAYTACPATRNHTFLKKTIDDVQPGWLDPGTAIGTGLGTAVTRLRSDTLQSKVIILLTDGESNKGELTPLAAAELARNKDIRVYTIGVGQDGYVSMPVPTAFGTIYQNTLVNIDERELKEIAKITGGAYFRATDNNSLREIYKTIEEMEKTKIVEENYDRDPPFSPVSFLLTGLVLLLLGLMSENYLFRTHG
jgi:Ca-activated chloride channel homolog